MRMDYFLTVDIYLIKIFLNLNFEPYVLRFLSFLDKDILDEKISFEILIENINLSISLNIIVNKEEKSTKFFY